MRNKTLSPTMKRARREGPDFFSGKLRSPAP
jgi:hypothetical protein